MPNIREMCLTFAVRVLPYYRKGEAMATIIKKIKKGRPYYYAVQSGRVNGKPRIVWQKYLGTVESIVQRAEDARPPQPKHAVIFEVGGVAALLRIAQRLGLLELINGAVPKRDQGPTVGHYMLLAALNRALAPCSKIAIGDWYEGTVLRRLWGFPKSAFSSQRFWDHMDMVSEEAIETVQEGLIPRIAEGFGLNSRILLYDTTNFFTFLATTNDRAELPQRGHSKAKRHDLRQVGLALLVAHDFQVPLLHRVYAGNVPDVSLFPGLCRDLIARYATLTGSCEDATVVFDKGNVSDDAMENLVTQGAHFVAALPANRFPELLAIPHEELEDLSHLPGTRVFSTPVQLWAKECLAVVAYTESFFTQQLAGVTHNLTKCQTKLFDVQKRLNKWRQHQARGKRPTVRGVSKSVREILSAQFMKTLFQVKVTEEDGLPCLQYAVDHAALRKLTDERLGRTLLITDQLEWTPARVVETYRHLASIEQAFKNMKNIRFLRWQPAYHWTDQKLRVHAFYCVLALLLSTLAHKLTSQAGISLSLPALLKELCAIREVAVIYPTGGPQSHITLSRMSPRQRKLAQLLEIAPTIHTG